MVHLTSRTQLCHRLPPSAGRGSARRFSGRHARPAARGSRGPVASEGSRGSRDHLPEPEFLGHGDEAVTFAAPHCLVRAAGPVAERGLMPPGLVTALPALGYPTHLMTSFPTWMSPAYSRTTRYSLTLSILHPHFMPPHPRMARRSLSPSDFNRSDSSLSLLLLSSSLVRLTLSPPSLERELDGTHSSRLREGEREITFPTS